MQRWIDAPVAEIIDYFIGTSGSFMTWARKLGVLIGILGILWCCIRLAFGTMEAQKAIVGTISKFIFYIAILNLYPGAVMALQKISLLMGTEAAPQAKNIIESELGDLYKKLDAKVAEEKSEFYQQRDAVDKKIDEVIIQQNSMGVFAGHPMYADYDPLLDLNNQKASIERAIKKREENKTGNARSLAALREVLLPVDENGQRTSASLTDAFVMESINLKDSRGNDTYYLSPSAMLKIAILAGEVMWNKEWVSVEAEWDANDKSDWFTGITEAKSLTKFPVYRIFDMVLVFASRIFIVVAMIFALIQYVMTLIEFTIIASVSVLCIPCMLMDELKDVANKVLPSMLSQAMKLTLVTMTMYFCCWMFLQMATNTIGETSNFNISTFAYVVFSTILAWAIVQNGPKIAAAIMTGQPQLSMGEMVAAMGTAATLGGAAYGFSRSAASTIKTGTAAVATGGINTLGAMAAMSAAGGVATSVASAAGKGMVSTAMSGIGAMAREAKYRTGQGLKSSFDGMIHGGGTKSPSGGGGMGSAFGVNRYQFQNSDFDGTNRDENQYQKAMDIRSAQDAKGRHMTAKEFMNANKNSALQREAQHIAKRKKKDGGENFNTSYTGDNKTATT